MSLPKPQIGSTKWLESPWDPSSVTFKMLNFQQVRWLGQKNGHSERQRKTQPRRIKTWHMEAHYSCDMKNHSRKKQGPGHSSILDAVRSKPVIQPYRFLLIVHLTSFNTPNNNLLSASSTYTAIYTPSSQVCYQVPVTSKNTSKS